MMTEAKILLKSIESCIQDAMDGDLTDRGRYLSRFRLVLNVLELICNDLEGCLLFNPNDSDKAVTELISKLNVGIRLGAASRTYLRRAETVCEGLLSRIHKKPAHAERIKQHHLRLLSVLVILDTACARMYAKWASYINYTAAEMCIMGAMQMERSKAIDQIAIYLTEGQSEVQLSNETCSTSTTSGGDSVRVPVGQSNRPGPVIITDPYSGSAATTATTPEALTVYPYPPNATASGIVRLPGSTMFGVAAHADATARANSLKSAASRFGPQLGPTGASASPAGAWLSGE